MFKFFIATIVGVIIIFCYYYFYYYYYMIIINIYIIQEISRKNYMNSKIISRNFKKKRIFKKKIFFVKL